jgi:hypothetical protein
MRRILLVICVLVIVVLLLIGQFGPSLVRRETVRLASPIFGATRSIPGPENDRRRP